MSKPQIKRKTETEPGLKKGQLSHKVEFEGSMMSLLTGAVFKKAKCRLTEEKRAQVVKKVAKM